MIRYILVFFLSLTSVSCVAVRALSKLPLDSYEQTQIHESVIKIKEAILAENITELLKYISSENGLSCTDTKYSYEQIFIFLKNKNSHLYLSLFDEKGFRSLCGSYYPKEYPASSEKEFLKSANDFIMVSKLDESWVQVTMTSQEKNRFPVWWYLHKEDGAWKVSSGSFVIGRCTCGG